MKKDEKTRQALIKKVKRIHSKIMAKIDREYFTASQAQELLSITRSQLYYWDSERMKLTEKRTEARKWRLFSIIDLCGFAVVNEILKLGLGIVTAWAAIDYIRYNLYRTPFIIYSIAVGDEIFFMAWGTIVGKVASMTTVRTVTKSVNYTTEWSLSQIGQPTIVVPLHPILLETLRRIKLDDFWINIVKPPHSKNICHIEFYIDEKPVRFDFNSAEMAFIGGLSGYKPS